MQILQYVIQIHFISFQNSTGQGKSAPESCCSSHVYTLEVNPESVCRNTEKVHNYRKNINT